MVGISVSNPHFKWGLQTVDKVPGARRGFSFLVIRFFCIFSVFIKKNDLLINAKAKQCFPPHGIIILSGGSAYDDKRCR